MAGKAGAQVPSKVQFCPVQGRETEWRQYAGRKRNDGSQARNWRCVECHSRSDRKSKAGRRRLVALQHPATPERVAAAPTPVPEREPGDRLAG